MFMESERLLVQGRVLGSRQLGRYLHGSYHGSFVQSGGLCCKVSPRSDVNQSCCRDSSLLWKQEGNP